MTKYKVEKFDSKTEKFVDFGGGYTEEDVKEITKGYKETTELARTSIRFFQRKNCRYVYMVTAERGLKNVEKVSEESRKGKTKLYINVYENALYTEPGTGRWYLTELIRYNTAEEIIDTVHRFANM